MTEKMHSKIKVLADKANYQEPIEPVYFHTQPQIVQEILEAKEQPLETCVSDDEVNW